MRERDGRLHRRGVLGCRHGRHRLRRGGHRALHLLRPHPLHASLEGRLLLLRALPVRLALRALRVLFVWGVVLRICFIYGGYNADAYCGTRCSERCSSAPSSSSTRGRSQTS